MNEEKHNIIIKELAEYPKDTIVTKEALCKILGRSPLSIDRAVKGQQIPPPIRFFGKQVWTSGYILDHIKNALSKAKAEFEKNHTRLEVSGV